MATRFSVVMEVSGGVVTDHGIDRARAVAEELFDEMRRLESLLSRFLEDSEISQINRLRFGESTIISQETYRCLELALEAKQVTQGYFDIAYLSESIPEGQEAFALLSRPLRVVSAAKTLHLDLGGIGKGFALERGRDILAHSGYSQALLSAGDSTVLAMNPPHGEKGWPAQMELDGQTQTLALANEALSCSGKTVRGEHIFDTRQRKFSTNRNRVYVRAPSPALSDAFATAAMTMPEELFRRTFFPCHGRIFR
jgi:thiamine biosynthesis lipoprotein